jgi:hypothetical protein
MTTPITATRSRTPTRVARIVAAVFSMGVTMAFATLWLGVP